MRQSDRVAETVLLAVDQITARLPDQVAVAAETTALTYHELTAAADRVARVLTERGIKPGDLVALALSRSARRLRLNPAP